MLTQVTAPGAGGGDADCKTNWYAVRVQSNKEHVVARHLVARTVPVFVPTYPATWSRKHRRAVERPLFPGYVMCRFEPSIRLLIVTIPGVVHIVAFGKDPISIPEVEIESVRALLAHGHSVQVCKYVATGSAVEIVDGPLSGLCGTVQTSKGTRTIVSINLLRRSVSAIIEPSMLAPLGGSRTPQLESRAATASSLG
jgi:transcription termination/antitermination protein NusG